MLVDPIHTRHLRITQSAGAALKPPNGLITLDYAFTHSASSLTFSGCTDRRSTLLAAHSHTVPFATLSPRRGLPLPIPAPMLVTFPSLVSCARTPLSLHPRSAPMFRSSCLWRLWRPEVGSACWFRRALSVPLVPQTFPLAQANPRLAHSCLLQVSLLLSTGLLCDQQGRISSCMGQQSSFSGPPTSPFP